MKVNFKELVFRGVDGCIMADENGTPVSVDISKSLGNFIYSETRDLGELELAQRVYKDGELDLTPEEVNIIGRYIKNGFKAIVQKAYNDLTGYGK